MHKNTHTIRRYDWKGIALLHILNTVFLEHCVSLRQENQTVHLLSCESAMLQYKNNLHCILFTIW